MENGVVDALGVSKVVYELADEVEEVVEFGAQLVFDLQPKRGNLPGDVVGEAKLCHTWEQRVLELLSSLERRIMSMK